MKIVAQRVSRALVEVGGRVVGDIGTGLCLLVGVAPGDTRDDAERLADKIVNLRIFGDPSETGGNGGRMDKSLLDIGGEALVISQFTLFADCRKGRRPSFTGAARPEAAEELYEQFAECVGARGINVRTGLFGKMMRVEIFNEGPVTIILDSSEI
jgi:D-tyrosyl-tRNA(Tyr) deacylase